MRHAAGNDCCWGNRRKLQPEIPECDWRSFDVVILELDRPMHGLTLHATADVTYALTSGTGGGAVAPYHIVTTGRATFSDSAIAIARMRFANERAMRENIEQFLRELR
jgi:hypothetical protein